MLSSVIFTSLNLASQERLALLQKPYTQNQTKFNFLAHPHSLRLILRLIVILSKHVLPCFCISPSQVLGIIQSGMLLCRVSTRNSVPILSSTWNRNSTQVGALICCCSTKLHFTKDVGFTRSKCFFHDMEVSGSIFKNK